MCSTSDCAVVTSVDLDHQAFLGDTVEQVGFEKAGVFRSGKPAICGQNPAPESLVAHAEAIGAKLLMVQRDFRFSPHWKTSKWNYRFHPQHSDDPARNRNSLPFPALRGAYQAFQRRLRADRVGMFERQTAGGHRRHQARFAAG